MYLLSNGTMCEDKAIFETEFKHYKIAVLSINNGFKICLIDSRTNCLINSNFRFSDIEAIKVAERTFNLLIKETFPTTLKK